MLFSETLYYKRSVVPRPPPFYLQAVIILWNRTEQFRHIISRSGSGSDTCSCPSLTLRRTLRVGKMSVQVFRTSTSPLPISEIIGVLRAPPEEKLSTLPPCKPKAGELYIYSSVNSPRMSVLCQLQQRCIERTSPTKLQHPIYQFYRHGTLSK